MGHRQDRVARWLARRSPARLWWLATLAACHAAAVPAPIVVPPVAPLRPVAVFEPRTGRTVITDTSMEILDPIAFVGNTAELTPGSSKILDSLAEILSGHTNILLVEVRGHSDWEEPDRQKRAELSIQRAETVVAALVSRGVDPARLQPYGASDSQLISTTDAAANRRVEIYILQRASD